MGVTPAQPPGDPRRRSLLDGRGRVPAAMRSGTGFTLLELMITVAVVAILATIAQGQYVAFIERAKVSTARPDIATMEVEIVRSRNGPTARCRPAWPTSAARISSIPGAVPTIT